MISKSLVIKIHDDKLKALFSQRGCFPVDLLNSLEEFIDLNSGVRPGSSSCCYRAVDVLKCLGNLKRYNFIELMFGVPKENLSEDTNKKLF